MQAFIIQDVNNGILSGKGAMPQKDSTSDGGNSFSLNRHQFFKSYAATDSTVAYKKEKKWFGNKDASQVTQNRRVNQIAKGSLNASGDNMSFTTVSDNNTQRQALSRMRNGGYVAPIKCRFKDSKQNVMTFF